MVGCGPGVAVQDPPVNANRGNAVQRLNLVLDNQMLETPSGSLLTFPYLILHHEEFAWPRLLPDAPVSSYLTVSPITPFEAT